MPVFDYKCAHCGKRFSLLVGVVAKSPDHVCPKCGGRNLVKQISRFSPLRSDEDIIDSLVDRSDVGDWDDPRQVRSWMKRMGKEMGEDLGDDFDEIFDEVESDTGHDDQALGC